VERITNARQSHDIFCFGKLLVFCFSKQYPHEPKALQYALPSMNPEDEEMNAEQMYRAWISDVKAIMITFPPRLQQLIQSCLEYDKSKRPTASKLVLYFQDSSR
jgi:hypothetical protein